MVTLEILQACSSESVPENKIWLEAQFAQLKPTKGSRIVILPECCLCFGRHKKQQLALAEPQTYQAMLNWFSKLAQRYQCAIVAGSLPALSADQSQVFNRTLVFDSSGEIVLSYDKIHLFDAKLKPESAYRESHTYTAGNSVAVVKVVGVQLGVAICYDLRFPELFQMLRLQGAEVIAIPAAFAAHTGQDHWQPLLQARAIETQCYMGASAQAGRHQNQRNTWGHSMCVDPWGRIQAEAHDLGWLSCTLDLDALQQVRQQMPVMNHRRFHPPQLQALPKKEKILS
jgi:predicted amidohydrolase